MASLLPGFEYDVFISYRQKDNKGDHWVTEFVNALKTELEATSKEDISIYFDENPHDGLHEHHDVDASLRDKLRCLVFLPVLSRTYCDPRSFAFEHEFKAFAAQAANDALGLKLKLPGGNVASRVLPVRIHELSREDVQQFEAVTGSTLRAIDFSYREAGVNRALKPADSRSDNLNKTDYRNQVNKVANAIGEILGLLQNPATGVEERPAAPVPNESAPERSPAPRKRWPDLLPYLRRIRISTTALLATALVVAVGLWLYTYAQWQKDSERAVEHIPIEFKNPQRERHNWGISARLSHDGRKILYQAEGGWHVYDLLSGMAKPIPGRAQATNIDFSPTNDHAVMRTASWMGQLYVVSLSSGQRRMVADAVLGYTPSWALTGWIYFLDLQGNIARVEASGENREIVIKREAPWRINCAVATAGSDAIIYARNKYDSRDPAHAEVMFFDLGARTSVSLGKGVGAVYREREKVLIVAQADGSLVAARYDFERRRTKGEFRKVLEGLETRGQGADRVGASYNLSDIGDLLYISRESISKDEIVRVDRKGRESGERVVMNGWTSGVEVSGDGRRLLASIHPDYGTAPNVWLKNLADGSDQKVSFGEVLDSSPRFVAADTAFAFVSPRDFQNWDLYRQALDGKSGLEKILDREGDIQDPDFSPGEHSVVFTERDIKGQMDVRVHHFGPEPRTVEVAASSANESSARFSPDGNFITFVSNETGRSEVYVVPYPNPNKLRWQISPEGGGSPAWSRRGNELFYRAPGGDLVAVKVDLQGAFSHGKPERLFNLNKMAWTRKLTPDDNFILIYQDLRAPGQVILVKNWMQEVLRKLDGK